jgi:hypothetical protein
MSAFRYTPTGIIIVALTALNFIPGSRAQLIDDSRPIRLADFVVAPSRFGVGERTGGIAVTLTQAELAILPQLGEDLYRTLARLPGVTADDFTAKFWVRGAPNGKLLARLDGVTLIEPFHLKDIDGALAIVDLPSVSRLDLLTGGFTADYGNRAAAVLNIETDFPSASTRDTSLGLSLSGMRGAHTGHFDGDRGRWRLTARRGYPDLALRLEGRDDELYPSYYDVSFRADYTLSPQNTVSVHALHAGDTLKVKTRNDPELNSNYNSNYLWARWLAEPSPTLSGETVLSFARLDSDRRGAGFYGSTLALNLRDERALNVTTLRSDWSLELNPRVLLRTGVEANHGAASYDYALLRDDNVVQNGVLTVARRTANLHLSPTGDRLGAFVAARLQATDRLILEPGVRFDHDSATGDDNVSPRLAAALPIGKRTTLRASWGYYYQSQGLHELSVPDNETRFASAERAEHRILGVEHRLASGLGLRVEAYERLTTHVRPRWDNTVNLYNVFPEVQSDRTRLAPTSNLAHGVEFLAEHRASRGFGWTASYALARAEDRIAGRAVPAARDQRHTLHLDAAYALGSHWNFSASWQYHTGWPATDVSYVLIPLNNGKRFAQRVVGPAYAARLPDYHRLDLRATRRWDFRRTTLTAFVDIFNAYDRTNLLGYAYSPIVSGNTVTTQREVRDLLPFVPSIGVTLDF